MVVLIGCNCDGLPTHSHNPTETILRNGKEITVPMGTAALNPGCEVIRTDPDGLRIWVDWKAVAHSLMADDEDRLDTP